ncbi:MAG: CaiB/BaiF CoA-transferase family protein [bacterium]|nr:CaiB/BaiF CoA-transferase family protein [bacterium]
MIPNIFSDVKVLDFSRLLPGPFASELLIRMGAEVQVILPPKADPILGDYSPFEKIRRGKRFEVADLKNPEDLKHVQRKLKESQILLEGFRPGTMERLGLGFEEVRKINPEILYVSLHGYDAKHPKYLQGAHDINFLVDSGVYSLLYPDASQDIPFLQIADLFGGFYAAFLILAEWIRRGRTPQAKHLEVSIVEGLRLLPDYLIDPNTANFMDFLSGDIARYRIYTTQDQKRVAIAAIEPKFFGNLMKALQLSYGPEDDGKEVVQAIQDKFSEKTLAQWQEILKEEDVCFSPIPDRSEVLFG